MPTLFLLFVFTATSFFTPIVSEGLECTKRYNLSIEKTGFFFLGKNKRACAFTTLEFAGFPSKQSCNEICPSLDRKSTCVQSGGFTCSEIQEVPKCICARKNKNALNQPIYLIDARLGEP